MTQKKKYKRLTNADKKLNREVKQQLIQEGILPPPKTPLNRKKFCKEVHTAFAETSISVFRIREALSWMVPMENTKLPITAEQVGVLKIMRIAVELERFWAVRVTEDKTSATLQELYEVVRPIIDL